MSDDRELQELRKRAYRRDSDIDAASLRRLHELERAQSRTPTANVAVIADPEPEPEPDPEPEPPGAEEAPLPGRVALAAVGRWIRGLRRSTILIALGTLLVVATLATVLVVVQRVQTDPLQAGATQIARLGVDESYQPPVLFAGVDGEGENHGYDVFYGMRAVTSDVGFYAYTGRDNPCISMYTDSKVTSTSDSFEGPLFAGCGAGSFPAMLQFSPDAALLPRELVVAFPDATGLQFVYDEKNDEIVVFVSE